jgi:phosphatidylglycerol:prolipoprotein diacylglycerol transferase
VPYVHDLNPVAIALGPVKIHWYGLMYLLGFVIFIALGRLRSREPWRGMGTQDVDDLLFYGVIGVIVGGRLGHVLFYAPAHFLAHPLDIFKIWEGGMASHGGLVGVVVVMWLFARARGKSFLRVCDFVAPLVPLGLGAGRIGNFINGELWGRVVDPANVPWAMIFPGARDNLPRHPSQLYQFALEGLLLFAILWIWSRKPRPAGTVGCLFLIAYGVLRIVGEMFREPESLYGLMPFGISAGQLLSIPMIAIGASLMVYFYRSAARAAGDNTAPPVKPSARAR